jgi:hypothetical protein
MVMKFWVFSYEDSNDNSNFFSNLIDKTKKEQTRTNKHNPKKKIKFLSHWRALYLCQ